jgi:hypothetical protein
MYREVTIIVAYVAGEKLLAQILGRIVNEVYINIQHPFSTHSRTVKYSQRPGDNVKCCYHGR